MSGFSYIQVDVLINSKTASFDITFPKNEFDIWMTLICLVPSEPLEDIALKATELLEQNDSFDCSIASSYLRIELKGIPYSIFVSADDDVSIIASTFVEEHTLKPEIKSKLEGELLRTQVDACLTHFVKHQKQTSWLRRKLTDMKDAVEQYKAAEATSERLSERLAQLEQLLEQIKVIVESSKAENEEMRVYQTDLEQQIETLTMSLNNANNISGDLENTNHDLQQRLQDMDSTVLSFQSKLDQFGSEKQLSEKELADLKEKLMLEEEKSNEHYGLFEAKTASYDKLKLHLDLSNNQNVNDLKAIRTSLEEKVSLLMMQLQAAERDIQTLQDRKEVGEEALYHSQQTCQQTEDELCRANGEIQKLSNAFNNSLVSQRMIDDHIGEIDMLSDENGELRYDNIQLKNEVSALRKQISALKDTQAVDSVEKATGSHADVEELERHSRGCGEFDEHTPTHHSSNKLYNCMTAADLITPAVEDRLLRAIFCRYAVDVSGGMNVAR